MAKYRSDKIKTIINQFKGKKRKFLQMRIENPETDNWTITKMAEVVGITRTTLYEYLQDEKMTKAIIDCSRMLYAYEMPSIVRSTIKNAKSGNTGSEKAQQIIHKVLGMTTDGNNTTVNIANIEHETTSTFKDSTEAIEDIDKRIAELQEVKQSLKNRYSLPPPLDPHAIHPTSKDGSDD